MFYIDYHWDLYKDRIVLDAELNTSKLGWQEGDYFKLVDVSGRKQMIKVDPIELFSKGVNVNGT